MREKVGLLCSLRVMLSSGAGPFLDGFSTASAAFLISLIEGITPLETAFFTSLYLAGSFIGAAIFGSIADHVGRRPPFLVTMAVVCVLTVLAATFPIIGLLLFMRLALGICLGGDYPVGQAMVFETVPAERRNARLVSGRLDGHFCKHSRRHRSYALGKHPVPSVRIGRRHARLTVRRCGIRNLA